jgi:hypothetical protein
VMTIGNHKPPVIKVTEKICFCDDCIKDNLVSACENIGNGYVSHWDLKEIVRKPPFEDVDIDIDIHDPVYLADYERISDLVMAGLCAYIHIYKLIYMYICFKINLYLSFYIHAGDIFAVQALPDNAENVDYYLLRCTKAKHKLLEGTIDADE